MSRIHIELEQRGTAAKKKKEIGKRENRRRALVDTRIVAHHLSGGDYPHMKCAE